MNPLGDAALGNVNALKCELAGEVLRSSGRLWLGVGGWSMLPTIWPGDTLAIERMAAGDVDTGDVVLFSRHGRLFVHRVITPRSTVAEGFVLTQGDGMPRPDQAVKRSEVLGRVSFTLRRGKRIDPRRSLQFFEYFAAALVRRFYWAARILAEVNTMRQQEQTIPCQK